MARVEVSPDRAGSPSGPAGFGLVLAATAALTASTSVVFPLLAQLQDAYDLPTWSLGLISGSAFLASLVAQLLLAPLADRGHVRLLLLGGLSVAAVSGVLFATGSTLAQLTLARLLGGLAVGAFVPAARAVASTLEPTEAGRNLGRLAAAELGGFVLGPVAGSALYELTGLRVPFLVFAGLAGAGLLLLAGRPLPITSAPTGNSRPSLALLRYRGVVVAALLALAIFLPVGVYDALWARYLEDQGAGPVFVGITLAFYGVPFVALASTGGRLADRLGPVRCAFACIVVIAPLTLLYGVAGSIWLIFAVALVEAAAQAVAVPASQAAMARATPAGSIAAGQGLAGALQQAGAGVVALLAAPLYAAGGAAVVFAAAATLIVIMGGLAWLANRGAGETKIR